LGTILLKYLDFNPPYNFRLEQYFTEVFSKNADIWGFLTGYEKLLDITNELNYPSEFKFQLIHILQKYCYSTEFATTAIPVPDLIRDLQHLNTILVQPVVAAKYIKAKAIKAKAKCIKAKSIKANSNKAKAKAKAKSKSIKTKSKSKSKSKSIKVHVD
jgi:hypothetical protein